MKTIGMLAFGLLILTATSAHSERTEKTAPLQQTVAAVPRTPLVGTAKPDLKEKATKIITANGKDCSCSEWKSVTKEECVSWDSQGKCTKTQTVVKRECVAWDHCH